MLGKINSEVSIRTYTVGDLPPAGMIEKLYAAASQPPPLSEPPEVAKLFAQLFGYARTRDDVVGVGALIDDEIVGFAYGHPWMWSSETDSWSRQLRHCLGNDSANLIDDSFAILLLAVLPSAGRRGLGAALLDALMIAAGATTYWLQTTDVDTPAQRLYKRHGYRDLGYGPEAPDGRPGLVLVHTSGNVR